MVTWGSENRTRVRSQSLRGPDDTADDIHFLRIALIGLILGIERLDNHLGRFRVRQVGPRAAATARHKHRSRRTYLPGEPRACRRRNRWPLYVAGAPAGKSTAE